MAKFKHSIYQPGKSGKVGGSVFSNGRYGPVERVYTIPVQPNSIYQLNERSKQNIIGSLWNTLNSGQRGVWDRTAIVFGFKTNSKSGNLTGYLLFTQVNRKLLDVGAETIKDCPQHFFQAHIFNTFSVAINATEGEEDIICNFNPGIPADNRLILCATPILKSDAQKPEKHLRVIGVKDTEFISGMSIKDIYIARFHEMPEAGSCLHFTAQFVETKTGQVGPVFQYGCQSPK
jgi:hypothetical protein